MKISTLIGKNCFLYFLFAVTQNRNIPTLLCTDSVWNYLVLFWNQEKQGKYYKYSVYRSIQPLYRVAEFFCSVVLLISLIEEERASWVKRGESIWINSAFENDSSDLVLRLLKLSKNIKRNINYQKMVRIRPLFPIFQQKLISKQFQ